MPLEEEEEEEEDGQIVSLDIYNRLASLNLLTVRVVVLESSQLHKKPYNIVVCEFGVFEHVLRDAGFYIFINVYRRYNTPS